METLFLRFFSQFYRAFLFTDEKIFPSIVFKKNFSLALVIGLIDVLHRYRDNNADRHNDRVQGFVTKGG
jgi:hypothetical protein